MSHFQRKMESFMYTEFLKAQSNSVRVDGSPAKHKPPPTFIYDWYYPIKIHKDSGICVASFSYAEFGLNRCFFSSSSGSGYKAGIEIDSFNFEVKNVETLWETFRIKPA